MNQDQRWSWAASWPELVIAGTGVAAVCAAGYAVAGPAGTAVVAVISGCAALIVLRTLVPPPAGGPPPELAGPAVRAAPVNGFWRRQSQLTAATRSLAGYDREVRGALQQLLSARLAERHGISLQADPDAARRLLLGDGPDRSLWFWLDPQRPPAAGNDRRPGIRPRTMAALLDRLERL